MRTKTFVWAALCTVTALSVSLMILAIFFYDNEIHDSKIVDDDDSYKVIKNSDTAFVLFYSLEQPKRGLYDSWISFYNKMQNSSNEKGIYLKKVECSVFRRTCFSFGVERYPTIAWMQNGEVIEEYVGDNRVESIQSFYNKRISIMEKEKNTTKVSISSIIEVIMTKVALNDTKVTKNSTDQNEKFIENEKYGNKYSDEKTISATKKLTTTSEYTRKAEKSSEESTISFHHKSSKESSKTTTKSYKSDFYSNEHLEHKIIKKPEEKTTKSKYEKFTSEKPSSEEYKSRKTTEKINEKEEKHVSKSRESYNVKPKIYMDGKLSDEGKKQTKIKRTTLSEEFDDFEYKNKDSTTKYDVKLSTSEEIMEEESRVKNTTTKKLATPTSVESDESTKYYSKKSQEENSKTQTKDIQDSSEGIIMTRPSKSDAKEKNSDTEKVNKQEESDENADVSAETDNEMPFNLGDLFADGNVPDEYYEEEQDEGDNKEADEDDEYEYEEQGKEEKDESKEDTNDKRKSESRKSRNKSDI